MTKALVLICGHYCGANHLPKWGQIFILYDVLFVMYWFVHFTECNYFD